MVESTRNHFTNYGPGENFLDLNTYSYKLVNGNMVLKGIVLGKGWENRPFRIDELSCYKAQKGEDSVTKESLNWEELDPRIQQLYEKGYTLKKMADELGISASSIHLRIKELKMKQAESLATEPAANQETVTEPSKPADESVPEGKEEVKNESFNVTSFGSIIAESLVERAKLRVDIVLADPIAIAIIKELVRQDVI